jgi:tyrosyl-tRNA synthetase
MGRNETDELSAAQIFYPCMQCADIFFLKVWSLIHARHPIHIILAEYKHSLQLNFK